MSYEKPYAGLKVVDLSQGVAGPYCAMLLAQHGADVIKVEPVAGGDWSRGLGRIYGDQTAYSIPANLGKRGLALDLKSDAGRAVLWRLIAGADVLVQGYRPGVIERLGFGYDAVARAEPRILYVSVSGFGPSGPLAERPAMDPVLQAFTGLITENAGEDGVPHRIPIIAIDMSTALYSFAALAPALYARREMSTGRHIEASLLSAAAGLQVVRMMQQYLEQGALRPPAAPSGVFAAADGWINVTIAREYEWREFCAATGMEALLGDPRFADFDLRIEHAEAMRAILRPVFAAHPVAHWSERLAARKVMHERLNTYREFLDHPQTRESGAVALLAHDQVPGLLPLPRLIGREAFAPGARLSHAPRLGEHSAEILAEHGYTRAEIAALAADGVIGIGGGA
ncbi:MAG: CoA transferase [Rhodospirillales bacterium]|nr:CoA transferase [Rhodospirillales bacterium]